MPLHRPGLADLDAAAARTEALASVPGGEPGNRCLLAERAAAAEAEERAIGYYLAAHGPDAYIEHVAELEAG